MALKNKFTYFLVFLACLAFLTLAAGTYLYLNLNKVKKYALVQLNQYLNATVDAKQIDVSFINTFPMVSLKLTDLVVTDLKNKEMLVCNSVYIGFDLLKLLKKDYEVKSIELVQGKADVYILKNGKINFDIVKSTDSTNVNNAYSFNLSNVELTNFELKFTDFASNKSFTVLFESMNLSGAFSNAKFKLKTKLNATLVDYMAGKKVIIKDKQIALNTIFLVDAEKKKLEFSATEIGLNKLKLLLNGSYEYGKQHKINAAVQTNKVLITDLISILPIKLPDAFFTYKSDGQVAVNGKINGNVANPDMQFSFGINNGTLTEPETGMALKQISFTGEFESNQKIKSKLTIKNLAAKLHENSQIDGAATLTDFVNPILDLKLNANVDLAAMVKFFKLNQIEQISGNVSAKVHLSGKLNTNLFLLPNNQISATFNIPSLKLANVAHQYTQIAGSMVGSNGKVNLNNLTFNYHKGTFNVSASSDNFISFVFDNYQTLTADVKVKSNFIDLQNLPFVPTSSGKSGNANTIKVNLNAKVEADVLLMDQFKAEAVTATAFIKTFPVLSVLVEPMFFKTCNGTVTGNIQFNEKNKGFSLTSNDFKINKIQINQLFKSFNNFGQSTLMHQHLNGALTTNLQFAALFDEQFNLLPNDLKTVASLQVLDGKLIDFKPLYALSKFVKLSELQSLSFSELSNTIYIADGMINIPTMDIKNNALNLQLTGNHSFNNDINYEIKLKLNELLKNKRSKADNEYGEEPESGNGLNLYLSMTGKADNPTIKYHTKAVKSKIKESAQAEKQNILNIIKQETGLGKKDSTIKKLEKKNNNNDELEFEAD